MNTAKILLTTALMAFTATVQAQEDFVVKACDASRMAPFYASRNYKGTCYFDANGELSYWVVRLWRDNSIGGGPDPAASVVVGSTLFLKKQQEYNRWIKSEPAIVEEMKFWENYRKNGAWGNGHRFGRIVVKTPEEEAANDAAAKAAADRWASWEADRNQELREAAGRAAELEARKLDDIRSTQHELGRPSGLTEEESRLLDMSSEQARIFLNQEAELTGFGTSDDFRRGLTKAQAESYVVAGSDYRVNPHGWLLPDPKAYSLTQLTIPEVIAETGAINLDTLSIPVFRLGVKILVEKERLERDFDDAAPIYSDLRPAAGNEYKNDFESRFDFIELPANSPFIGWQRLLKARKTALDEAEQASHQSAELIKGIPPGELPAGISEQLASLQRAAAESVKAEESLAVECDKTKRRFENLDKLSPKYKARMDAKADEAKMRTLDEKIKADDKRYEETQQRLRDARDAWCRENPNPGLCQ